MDRHCHTTNRSCEYDCSPFVCVLGHARMRQEPPPPKPAKTVITADDRAYHKAQRKAFETLPVSARRRCLDHLDGWISPEQVQELKTYRFDPVFHMFGGGMAIRNRLRDMVLDEALPAVQQQNGEPGRNWDDYYLGAVDALIERHERHERPATILVRKRWYHFHKVRILIAKARDL